MSDDRLILAQYCLMTNKSGNFWRCCIRFGLGIAGTLQAPYPPPPAAPDAWLLLDTRCPNGREGYELGPRVGVWKGHRARRFFISALFGSPGFFLYSVALS